MVKEIADSTLLDTWGSSGAKIEPDISKIIEGWQLGEQPPHEYMNWLQNTFGSKLNHILKNGVAGWNNETEYLAGSSVQHNGNVWLCKATNTNSEPTDANANWKRILTVEALTTGLNGYVKTTGNETIAGIKTFSSSPIVPTPTADTQAANKAYVDTQITGLGTAASRNVGTEAGQVMEVGAFGVGHTFLAAVFDANEIANLVGNKSGFYPYLSKVGGTNIPYTYVYIQQLFYTANDNVTQIAYGYNLQATWIRYRYDGVWSQWVKQLTSNDMQSNSDSVKTALNASGEAPIYACRAWVNFNGTGTVAIRASGNVSSITDNEVGDYTVNFTTAMPDANYGVNGLSSADSVGFGDISATIFRIKQSVAPTVSAVRVTNSGGSASILDCIYGHISIFR